MLLAIETTTDCCSAALYKDGTIISKAAVAPRQHTHLIFEQISELLALSGIEQKDIQGLCLGNGPGSFTGSRLGLSVIQGLALAIDCPVWQVSSLEALAWQAYRIHGYAEVQIVQDARMNQSYFARFQCSDSGLKCVSEIKLLDQHLISEHLDHNIPTIGTGIKSADLDHDKPIHYPLAEDVLHLSLNAWSQKLFFEVHKLEALYLRQAV